MKPRLARVGLLLTLQCPSQCRHCFFQAGPHRSEEMPRELGVKVVEEASALGAGWLSLTGGEPFTRVELMEFFTRLGVERGMRVEAVTNGFWASDMDTAVSILERLRRRGLRFLSISVDDFHQENIPLERVKTAYHAAVSLGLRVVLLVCVGQGSKLNAQTVPKALGADRVQVVGGPPVEHPEALLIESPYTSTTPQNPKPGRAQPHTLRCEALLTDIGVDPQGNVLPCCGPLASQVSLGSLREESLEEILVKAWGNPLLAPLRRGVEVDWGPRFKCQACLEWFGKRKDEALETGSNGV